MGVMEDHLLSSKSNAELIQPLHERIQAVRAFLERMAAGGQEGVYLDITGIQDGYGPTRFDPDIQALVVSRETLSGGEAVNRVRREGGLGELEVFVIDVIASEGGVPYTVYHDEESESESDGEGEQGGCRTAGTQSADRTEADSRNPRQRIRMQKARLPNTNTDVARDLTGVHDEKTLKELKMGSTAIRQWIKDHGADHDQE